MTRDEAIKRLTRSNDYSTYADHTHATNLLDALVALGLLKFDEPKEAHDWERQLDYWRVFSDVADWMRVNGFDPAEAVLTITSDRHSEIAHVARIQLPAPELWGRVNGLRVHIEPRRR